MPIDGAEKTITAEGGDKKAFVVTFTNGALEQVEELKSFFKANNNLELVKLGISLLQQFKERGEQEDKKT